MKAWRALPIIVAGALAAACTESTESSGPISGLPRRLSVTETALIWADNRFAFKLFHEIQSRAGADNVFVSPLSVAMALGMTYNGAAGQTQSAMQQTLELSGLDLDAVNQAYRSVIDLLSGLDPSVDMILANSIWHRSSYTFAPGFLDLNRRFFDAQVSGLDFDSPTASGVINGWVNSKTNGKIREIVPASIPHDAIMYLINAVYFKGTWTHQFDQRRTRPALFHLADGAQVTVPLMSRSDEITVRHLRVSGAEIVDLPYGGGAFSMTVVLPDSATGIGSVSEVLNSDEWNSWIAVLDSTRLMVSLPKFVVEYSLRMNDVLGAMGMQAAFCNNPVVEPDFTRMYPAGGACISEVKHKTYIDVNEEGTEAAAATSVEIGITSAPPMFVVDRPFILVIRERFSGTILFMGKIMNPVAP